MDAYLFIDATDGNLVLHVPANFIARADKGNDEFYTEFNPERINKAAISLAKNRKTIQKGLDTGTIQAVEVDDADLKRFRTHCFKKQFYSARVLVGEMFAEAEYNLAEEQVEDELDEEDDDEE